MQGDPGNPLLPTAGAAGLATGATDTQRTQYLPSCQLVSWSSGQEGSYSPKTSFSCCDPIPSVFRESALSQCPEEQLSVKTLAFLLFLFLPCSSLQG